MLTHGAGACMLWAEWRVHEEAELARLRRQLESGGYSGVYFNTEGLLHTDFELGGEPFRGLNDPKLEPLWELVEECGAPV